MEFCFKKNGIYNLPKYYGVAFSWDISSEIEFFREVFKRHVPFCVKNILEPACGTGRFLINLPKHGYNITGYDKNPKMVAYARKRIADLGLQDRAIVVRNDMKSAEFDAKFDAAVNSINSIGYLLSDNDIISHFHHTGNSLRRGGVYIVHLACAWNKLETDEDEGWTIEKDGIRVKTIWIIKKEDKQKKLSYQICKMEIDDHGQHFSLEDHHTLRLWFFDDLKELIRKSEKLKLAAIYDEKHRQISLNTKISGELGNLYYVLKVL